MIAIVIGLLGAIASIFLERVVVAIAGFFAGGYFLSAAATVALPNTPGAVPWLAFVAGGIIGAILTAALLDPALVLLSFAGRSDRHFAKPAGGAGEQRNSFPRSSGFGHRRASDAIFAHHAAAANGISRK